MASGQQQKIKEKVYFCDYQQIYGIDRNNSSLNQRQQQKNSIKCEEIEVQYSQKDQKGFSQEYKYMIGFDSCLHYNQLSEIPNDLSQNLCEQLQPHRIILRMEYVKSKESNFNHLQISAALYAIFMLHQKIQISYEARSQVENLIKNTQNNKYEQNYIIRQRLLKILLQKIQHQDIYSEIRSILQSDTNCREVLNFILKEKDQNHASEIPSQIDDCDQIIKLLCELFQVIIIKCKNGSDEINILDNQLEKENEKTYYQDIETDKKNKFIPIIIINQIDEKTVYLYHTLPSTNIIEDEQIGNVKYYDISELQKRHPNFQNNEDEGSLYKFFQTINPLESITMVTYINYILEIINIYKIDPQSNKQKIDDLLSLFYEPFKSLFQQNGSSKNLEQTEEQRQILFQKKENQEQAALLKAKIEEFQKIQTKDHSKAIDCLIEIINYYEQKNKQLRKITYEYERDNILKIYDRKYLISHQIIDYFDKVYDKNHIDKDKFPKWFIHQTDFYIILSQNYIELQNKPLTSHKEKGIFYKIFCCFCFDSEEDLHEGKKVESKRKGQNVKENEQQLIEKNNPQKNINHEEASYKYKSPEFRFIFDIKTYEEDYNRSISLCFNRKQSQFNESNDTIQNVFKSNQASSEFLSQKSYQNIQKILNKQNSQQELDNLSEDISQQQPQLNILPQEIVIQRNPLNEIPRYCKCGRNQQVFYPGYVYCKNCFFRMCSSLV